MKTIAISDLHGLLPEIVEPADIMFICGDISPLHIQFNKPWSNKSLEHVGNEPLANRLKEIQFAWCFHGHIHSSSHEPEAIEGENTGFVVNVSYCNESYDGIYEPLYLTHIK